MLKKYGFTLAEVLLVIAAMSIIGGVGAVYMSRIPSSPVVTEEPSGVVTDTSTKTPEGSEVGKNVPLVSEVSVTPTTPAADVKPATKPAPVVQTPTPVVPVVNAVSAQKASGTGKERIVFLHHSTGGNIWGGGVPAFFTSYNTAKNTQYQITETAYPNTKGGYPWANYPYDYWNLWVKHTGTSQDRGEQNLDQITASYDVIVFKHCYPVSGIKEDNGNPDIASSAMTIANYKLQYAALKAKMKQYPSKKFIVWTGAALTSSSTNPADATRAKEFFTWVKSTWDEPGDNIFVWDLYILETEGGLYMKDAYAGNGGDPHPNGAFSKTVAPYFGQRIIDVIEGRGDTASVTGK